MRKTLTQPLIDALRPSAKPYEVRDKRIRELLLRVQPSGASAFYLVYGRGRRRRLGPGSVPIDDIREIAHEYLATLAKGKDPGHVLAQSKKLTFLQFIEQEFERWAAVHLRTSTKLVQRLKSNCRQFHSTQLGEVSAQEFEKWRTKRLQAKKARKTVNRDLDDVRGVLSKALEWGFIEANPLAGVKKLKTDKMGSTRFLSGDEEVRLVAELSKRDQRIRAARDRGNAWRKKRDLPLLPTLHNHVFADHLQPMIITSLNTGVRQGELFELRWAEVNFEQKLVTIRGEKSKNLQTRHIPLNTPCHEALSRWRDQCPDDAVLVFPGKSGERLDNVNSAWRSVLKNATIDKFRWHDLRHTFASRLVMKGVDLNTVRDLMGHADIQMTLRYSHLAPEHKAEAVERLAN